MTSSATAALLAAVRAGAVIVMFPALFVALPATRASADEPRPTPTLSVVRDESARDCPSEAAIVAEVVLVTGEVRLRSAEPGAAPSVVVRFARNDEDGLVATVEPKNGGTRRFVEAKRECASLAKVVSVALAIWLDEPEAKDDSAPATSPPVVVPETASEAPPEAERVEPPKARVIDDLQVSALAQAASGITAPWALALGLHVRASRGPIGIGVGGRWHAPDASSIGPARVRASALGGWLDGCVAAVGPHGLAAKSERVELHPCGTLALNAVTAESSGIAATDRVTSSWLGAGAALLGVVRPAKWLGLGVRAEALVPFRRERFVVIGAGTAYAQSPVAAFIGAGIVLDVL